MHITRPIHYRPLFLAIVVAFGLDSTRAALGQESYTLGGSGQWQQQASAEADSPAGQLQAARRALAEGRHDHARKLADAWLKKYGDDPLAVEAYLLRADARAASGNYYKALFDYEHVIRTFPASEQFFTALEREYHIAMLYSQGLNRTLLGMPILPATGEAEELLIRMQERAPGSDLGERASIALGDHYYRLGQWSGAADAYDLFLVNYPRSRFREHAMLRLIQANLAQFRGSQYDPTGLIQATQYLKRYQQEFPAAASKLGAETLLEEIRGATGEKLLYSASWYDRRHEQVSAAFLYRRLAEQFPDTTAGREALRRLDALGELASDMIEAEAGPQTAPTGQPTEQETLP